MTLIEAKRRGRDELMRMTRTGEVKLGAMMYSYSVKDYVVTFTEMIPIYGSTTKFSFSRRPDIGRSPGHWQFTVDQGPSHGGISAAHIEQAYTWCKQKFGRSFEPYKCSMA